MMSNKNAEVFAKIQQYYESNLKNVHLKDLLQKEERSQHMTATFENIYFDYSRQQIDCKVFELLENAVAELKVWEKIEAMFKGEKINTTENRSVLHVALRAKSNESIVVEGKNVITDVHEILNRIKDFSQKIRNGELRGYSNKPLSNVIVIGIGGSYLGIEFVYEAIKYHKSAADSSAGRKLRFLANVDPNDFHRCIDGLNPEETLVVINSKTFTTAETMLNARTVRNWILSHYKDINVLNNENEAKIVNAHMTAVSTNLADTKKFGIESDRVFGFWDWVGGRFSVWSAIGMLPLSLHFGYEVMQHFLDGGHSIDQHFLNTKKIKDNIPLLIGLIGFYQVTIQNHQSRAILPYSQAMCKFAPHIQQLEMESNGKQVSLSGELLPYGTTVVNFGEPGTNGQHSFYQLLHQGRVVPAEFIGFCKNQTPVNLPGEIVPSHDELMSNFFSQTDALAYGKTTEELKAEGCPEKLINHKLFMGNRPSVSILIKELTPYTCGQILAMYEHRTSVEGFLWDINSYDQYGVELGKVLAVNVRKFLGTYKDENSFESFKFNNSTKNLLKAYLSQKDQKYQQEEQIYNQTKIN